MEPVGRWFEAYVRRRNRTTSASFVELVDEEESSEESEDEEFQIEEDPMIRTLDPKDWKVKTLTLCTVFTSVIVSNFSLLQSVFSV